MRVLIFSLMFTLAVNCDHKSTLAGHINSMISAENSLEGIAEIHSEEGKVYEFKGVQAPQTIFQKKEKISSGASEWQPFLEFENLMFGTPYKSLETSRLKIMYIDNLFNSCTYSYYGSNLGTAYDLVTVYSCVKYRITKHILEKQRLNRDNDKPCRYTGIQAIRGCHLGNVKVFVALTPDEMAKVVSETERLAAIAMKKKLGLGSEEPTKAFQLAQGSKYITSLSRLNALLPKASFSYNDLDAVQISQAQNALKVALDGRADQGIRDKIVQILGTATHSNFFLTPTDSHLYFLIVHRNSNGTFNLHVRHFVTDQGKKLPTGAFAVSLGQGGWKLERAGAGSTPSVQQLLAAFPYE